MGRHGGAGAAPPASSAWAFLQSPSACPIEAPLVISNNRAAKDPGGALVHRDRAVPTNVVEVARGVGEDGLDGVAGRGGA
eukprot:14714580-Alexandrium_andersonii.AAC.1